MRNKILYIAIALNTIIVLGIALSPYKKHDNFDYPLIKQTIVIDAPLEQVYHYLGDSKNAAKWSSFVDHITPINTNEVPDGSVGSKRICYVNADETGREWEEETTIVEPLKRRQLSIYNIKNFGLNSDFLVTEQLYHSLSDKSCELSLTLFLDNNHSFWDRLKMYYASYTISPVFKKNLENIKKENE